MNTVTTFDHIAIASPRMSDAGAVLMAELGAVPAYGGDGRAYRFGQWRFANGARLEVLEPVGAEDFLHRFLAQHGPGVHHVGSFDAGPLHPGLLDDVLGVGGGAEHLVGDCEQQAAVGDERIVGHALPDGVADGVARGSRPQLDAYSCDSIPNATLDRVAVFASAMYMVSSTSASAPRASSNRADSSSLTVGGVRVIASA